VTIRKCAGIAFDRRHLLPVRSTQPCHEQIANRACRTHSSPAPAASHESSYRKCPGGKHFDFPPLLGAGALVDRKLDFSQSAARYLQDDNNGGN